MHTSDGSVAIGERASELMRAYSRSASPQAYELWYAYVTRVKPALNRAVKARLAAAPSLSGEDIEALHGEFLSADRGGVESDRIGTRLLLEVDQAMGLVAAAMGSSARYGASLEALSSDLSAGIAPDRLNLIVEALVTATRQVAGTNRDLEARLRRSGDEIRELKKALETVRIESLTDPLTAIANRTHFEATLGATIARAQAEGSWLVLIAIDIDHFKRLNDTWGHLTGDQVLRLVAAAMRENVGTSATLARCGGEEFAIILPDMRPDEAYGRAEALRLNVMNRELVRRSTGESLGRVTVSLGVAALRPHDSMAAFIERADRCMYQAKETGRNRTVADWHQTIAERPSAA